MVIRNMETGRGARGFTTLIVPEAPAGAVRLDPPLLLAADRKAHDVGNSAEAALSSLYAYDRASYAPISGEIPAGAGKLYAALRCTAAGESSEIDLSVSLSEEASPAQSDVPFTVVGRSQDRETKFYLLELTPAELKPGRYRLVFLAKRAASNESASATAVITVKSTVTAGTLHPLP